MKDTPSLPINIIEPRQAKMCLRDMRESDQDLCRPLPEPLDAIKCINGQQSPRYDLVPALDDVNPQIT